MKVTFEVTIPAYRNLSTDESAWVYLDRLIAETPRLGPFREALREIVNASEDEHVVLYEPADFTKFPGVDPLMMMWLPQRRRAAIARHDGARWAWIDAADAEEAKRICKQHHFR